MQIHFNKVLINFCTLQSFSFFVLIFSLKLIRFHYMLCFLFFTVFKANNRMKLI